jgi:hypothetical protein
VECLIFQSCSNINFSTSSTLWLAIFKSSSEFVTLLTGICKWSSFYLMPQQSYSKDKGGITSLLVQLLTNVACDWMRILFPYALHIEFRCNFPVPISLTSVGSCFEHNMVRTSKVGATNNHSLWSSCVQNV